MDNNRLKHLFDTHPGVDEFYITSDGFAFVNPDHAHDHARKLPSQQVSTIHRADIQDPNAGNKSTRKNKSTTE
jgi:hypothetical protein